MTGSLWPAGTPAPAPLRQYDPNRPWLGGWDGTALRWRQPYLHFSTTVRNISATRRF